ncbi:HGxxPAAW family protein [Cellulomonas taurus]|uniref:HGxxPAAW family protein n=1 Tax=Cellulomonas taurus TaxID=2729175 RepID=UPI001FECA95C|nr:HGxxPAAW family protein [Cellulomonas taurus]
MAGQPLRTENPRGGVAATAQGPRMEALRLPPVAPPTNHGRTVAAWTVTYVVVAGFLVAALAMIFSLVWLFWVGMGAAIAGVVAGIVLRAAGFGQGGKHTPSHHH